MDIYDPIAIALGIEPIELEPINLEEVKKNSISTGINTFPSGVHGTQDRSFMQTIEYKKKQSLRTKHYWNNCSLERREQARLVIQKTTRKKVYAEGIVFDSLTLCADHYNVALETIRMWMRKGKNFYYI